MATEKQIKARIVTLSKSKVDEQIQTLAIDTVAFAKDSGRTHLIEMLLAAMPKGSRVKGLIKYLHDHAPLIISDKDGYSVKLKKGRTDEDFKLDAMSVTAWHAYTKEREPAPFNYHAAVKGLLTRITNALEDGKVKEEERSNVIQLQEYLKQQAA